MDNKQQVTNNPINQPIPSINAQPIVENQQPITNNSQPSINNQASSTPIRTGANLLLLIPGILLIIGGAFLGLISFAFAGDSGQVRIDGVLFSLLIGAIPTAIGIALIVLGNKIRTKNKSAKLLGKILLAIIGLLLIINGIIGISSQRTSCEQVKRISESPLFKSPRNDRDIDIYCNSAPTHSIIVITIGSSLIGLAILLHLIKSKK